MLHIAVYVCSTAGCCTVTWSVWITTVTFSTPASRHWQQHCGTVSHFFVFWCPSDCLRDCLHAVYYEPVLLISGFCFKFPYSLFWCLFVNHHLRSAQVWHVFSRDLTVLPAQPNIQPQLQWAIPFAFPAITGTHLPTSEGWKAELAWVAGYVVRQFTCPKAVTHPTTNRAKCRASALVETNTLLLH